MDEEARRAAERWMHLILARDVDELVKMADVPFYDNRVLGKVRVTNTREELRQDLDHLRGKETPKDLSVKITRVMSYPEGWKLLWSARKQLDVVLEEHYVEGKKEVRPRGPRNLDEVFQKDDRLVWLEASETDPGGKFGTETCVIIFRKRDGVMKWIGNSQ
jgi:hypothetical protein